MALDIWYSSASNALEAEEYQRRGSWEKMNKVKCIYNKFAERLNHTS